MAAYKYKVHLEGNANPVTYDCCAPADDDGTVVTFHKIGGSVMAHSRPATTYELLSTTDTD